MWRTYQTNVLSVYLHIWIWTCKLLAANKEEFKRQRSEGEEHAQFQWHSDGGRGRMHEFFNHIFCVWICTFVTWNKHLWHLTNMCDMEQADIGGYFEVNRSAQFQWRFRVNFNSPVFLDISVCCVCVSMWKIYCFWDMCRIDWFWDSAIIFIGAIITR